MDPITKGVQRGLSTDLEEVAAREALGAIGDRLEEGRRHRRSQGLIAKVDLQDGQALSRVRQWNVHLQITKGAN